MTKRKILIIGIDGGTWRILKPAMEEGYMPFLKSQKEKGTWGILESTIPAVTPAAWASFQTGVNPGKTGVVWFTILSRRDKKLKLVNSTYLGKTVWEYVSDAGKNVGVLNVPLTYPPKKINGFIVSGILTPSLESNFTYPPELKDELLKEIRGYQILNQGDLKNVRRRSSWRNFKEFVNKMINIVNKRAEAANFLMEKYPSLDLFMVHFMAPDIVSHAFWGYMDDTHPLFDRRKRHYIFSTFYQNLDQKIFQIKSKFEKEIAQDGELLTLIVSDHGQQAHIKRFNLANWLHQNGFSKIDEKNFKKTLTSTLMNKIDLLNLRSRLPKKVKKTLSITSKSQRFEWYDSRAFSMGRSNEGFIYILEDKEENKKATEKELRKKLNNVIDPETGERIVKKIYRKEELYTGRRLSLLPDLIIQPNDGYSFTGEYQPNEGLFHRVNVRDDIHIGMHHPDGIIIASGNSIIHNDHSFRASILDITPTILYYFGIPIPDHIDGKVLKDIFSDE